MANQKTPSDSTPPENKAGTAEQVHSRAPGRRLNLQAKLKPHTSSTAITGTIEEFIPGEVAVLVASPILPDTNLTVEINHCAFTGEVLFCHPRRDGHVVHISIHDSESNGYRRTPRFLVRLPALLFAPGSDGPREATIVDISGDGIGLLTSTDLPLETSVVVESESNIAMGLVRYSLKQSEEVSRIGVKVYHIIPRLDYDENLNLRPSTPRFGNILSFGRAKGFLNRRTE